MYLKHFGLAQYPFSLRPATQYFQKLQCHQKAFDTVIAAIDGPSCFNRICGELGAGKTTLCRKLLQTLTRHGDRYACVFISNPIHDEQSFIETLAFELGIAAELGETYSSLLKRVSRHLLSEGEKGLKTLILIDDVQAMPEETLKSLNLLAQINHQSKVFHVTFFGQPEFEQLLQQTQFRELRSEVKNNSQLTGLQRDEIDAYIRNRLKKGGYSGTSLFTKLALDKLYEGSRGVPRMVNVIAHKCLMLSAQKGAYEIDPLIVQDAIENRPVTTDEAEVFFG